MAPHSPHHPDVLFICKKNECYGFQTYTRRSAGLYNSTRFIVEALEARGMRAHIVEVTDNNDIDREVTRYRPKFVVIEALWVVPSKFPVLQKLHPKVKWLVHLHSHIPFLALEGIAIEWLKDYTKLGIGLIANSVESFEALDVFVGDGELSYLPNVYSGKPKQKHFRDWWVINIGCFGAVRPLKNQLLQALAAIEFARERDQFLYFHINASRVETGGGPVLKNLIALFEDQPRARLIQHQWHEPHQFLETLHYQIDIGMQVSLTETFNVVSADCTMAGVPIVVSKEVKWASHWCKAQEDSLPDIVKKLRRVYRNQCLVNQNQKLLLRHSKNAGDLWFRYFKGGQCV